MLFLNSENTKGTYEGGCKTSFPKEQNRGGGARKMYVPKGLPFVTFAFLRKRFFAMKEFPRGRDGQGGRYDVRRRRFLQATYCSKKLAVKNKNPFRRGSISGAFYGTHLFYHGEEARDRFAHQPERSIEEEWRYRNARNEKVAAHF